MKMKKKMTPKRMMRTTLMMRRKVMRTMRMMMRMTKKMRRTERETLTLTRRKLQLHRLKNPPSFPNKSTRNPSPLFKLSHNLPWLKEATKSSRKKSNQLWSNPFTKPNKPY